MTTLHIFQQRIWYQPQLQSTHCTTEQATQSRYLQNHPRWFVSTNWIHWGDNAGRPQGRCIFPHEYTLKVQWPRWLVSAQLSTWSSQEKKKKNTVSRTPLETVWPFWFRIQFHLTTYNHMLQSNLHLKRAPPTQQTVSVNRPTVLNALQIVRQGLFLQ